MGGEYEISGVVDGSTVVIKTAEPFDDGYSPKGVNHNIGGDGDEDDFDGHPPF